MIDRRLKIFVLSILLIATENSFSWQDDIAVNLRDPFAHFKKNNGFGFLDGALAEVLLGRYLVATKNHVWRGGVEGDVALLSYGDVLLHFGLNVETLADDLNDIHFRLVHVYYQALTGIKWRLGSGILHAGVRHRCNHGADAAEMGRITIRLGFTSSYHWTWRRQFLEIDLLSGLNAYVLGQNNDFSMQPKGGMFFSANATWPVIGPMFFTTGIGTNFELITVGNNWVYLIHDSINDWHIEPLFAGRIAVRFRGEKANSDWGFRFAQNLDSGLGKRSQKIGNFSFDIDFWW